MKKINFYSIITPIIAIALVLGSIWFLESDLAIAVSVGVGAVILLLPILIRNPDIGLTMIAFLLPFERIPSVDVGGFSIKINFILILAVAFIFFSVKLAQRKLVIPRDPTKIFIIIFMLLAAISITQAVNVSRAMQVFALLLLMIVTYLTVTTMTIKEEMLISIAKGLFWGGAVAGLFGMWQFLGDMAGLPNTITLLKMGYDKSTFGFARIQAASQEPLYFANFLFIPIALTCVLLIKNKIELITKKVIAYPILALLVIDFILTVSRGAYIGAVFALLALLASQWKIIFKIKTIVSLLLVALFIGGGTFIFLYRSESRAVDEFVAHVSVQDRTEGESVVSRLDATELANQLFLTSPFIGVGIGNYGPITQGDPAETPDEGWFIVNNEYMEILAETGVLGLIAFVLILLSLIYRAGLALKASNKESFTKDFLVAMGIAMTGILVQYATFSTIYIFHIWFVLALVSASTMILLENKGAR